MSYYAVPHVLFCLLLFRTTPVLCRQWYSGVSAFSIVVYWSHGGGDTGRMGVFS